MDLWNKTLDLLQQQVEPYDYQHWLLPIQCAAVDPANQEIALSVPDESHGRLLEEHFMAAIKESLHSLTQQDYAVHVSAGGAEARQSASLSAAPDPVPPTAPAPPPHVAAPARAAHADEPPPRNHHLIQRYRFESFVDGPTNQFAMTAAKAVAEHPGTRYNPLFIFGGVGLGKTHLLHAVGHAVADDNPDARILYVTSETYVNDLIAAIRTDRMHAFRRRYRDECDVLLVDDIQFIAGKDRSQEEFFHMFNTLHSSHKQIVLTCDQLPQSIPDMEDRLRSRLTWGLIADIKPPGFETRVAILKRKAESDAIDLPDDVAYLIARHVTRNVRELEGALMRLDASARMMHRVLDLELAHQVLGDIIGNTTRRVSPETIIKLVCQEFKVSMAEIKGPRRHRSITVPRQIAMYLVRDLSDESLPQIGNMFGGRDHSTVINALKRVEQMREGDPNLRARIEKLRRNLRD